MHPINFDSYVTVCPPDCRNHRHTNKKQLNQQVWQPKCNSRFNLEGPGLVFFSIIFDVYTHMAHTGPEKSLKKRHVLEKSLNWKIVGYSWKVLEVSTEVLEYFWKLLEWKEPSFKKGRSDVLCKGMIESTTTHKFSLVIVKVFSYDFGVPGIVHFPLFEVPLGPYLNEKRYCNKQIPLQLCILKVFTSCLMLL